MSKMLCFYLLTSPDGHQKVITRQRDVAYTIGVSQQAVSLALQKNRSEIAGWKMEVKNRLFLAVLSDKSIVLLWKDKGGRYYSAMDGSMLDERMMRSEGAKDITENYYEGVIRR